MNNKRQRNHQTTDHPGENPGAPPTRSRIAAAGALVVSSVTLVALILLTTKNLVFVVASFLFASLGISALWIAATNRRFRWWAGVGAVLLVGAAVASLVAAGRGTIAVAAVIIGIAIASTLGSVALGWEVSQALAKRWHPVPPSRHGVVLMNPWSGNGKVAKLQLAEESRRRGLEAVELHRGDDLRALAEAAVSRGADALGMAGGDGSQAVVAAVAAKHGVAFVCVPAGTRNHLALDLGIDRDDPVSALDAFGRARESVIDLGEVNGEVFVNNVSLGVYAQVVANSDYRAAKERTVAEMLPDLVGPDATPFGLSIDAPDGPVADVQLIQISNNPYTLSSVAGFGSRPRLDSGALGVATLTVHRASEVNRLVALELAGHPERFEGWHQWAAHQVDVQGPPTIAAAMDGESCKWGAPLHFAIRSSALRVRIAPGEYGGSPAFRRTPISVSTLIGLVRVVRGRPSGIVPFPEG